MCNMVVDVKKLSGLVKEEEEFKSKKEKVRQRKFCVTQLGECGQESCATKMSYRTVQNA